MPDSAGGAPVAWRGAFRRLSSAYGWTPDEIGALTLGQVTIYLHQVPDRGARCQMNRSEAEAFVERRRREREAWIEQALAWARRAAAAGAVRI